MKRRVCTIDMNQFIDSANKLSTGADSSRKRKAAPLQKICKLRVFVCEIVAIRFGSIARLRR